MSRQLEELSRVRCLECGRPAGDPTAEQRLRNMSAAIRDAARDALRRGDHAVAQLLYALHDPSNYE